MRRVSRQLLRSAASAARRREAPAPAWCRALATSQPAAGHSPALAPRAAASSAPAGWAASVLEAASGRLQGDDDAEESSDSESDDESEEPANAGATARAAPFSDDEDDDSSDDDEADAAAAAAAAPLAALGARGVQASRLAWPPPPGALAGNPELARMVRRASHAARRAACRAATR
jgi:hypothetical protein